METITAEKLIAKLKLVPGNTPVYVIGGDNDNKLIDLISIESDSDTNYNKYEVRLDYVP